MSDYGERRACILEAFEPSERRVVRLGKIVPLKFRDGGAWAYVNNLNAQLRETESFGVAPPVVKLMDRWNVELVVYFWGKTPYLINRGTIERAPRYSHGNKVPYFQVPIRWWRKLGYTPSGPWVNNDDVLTLAWDEPARTYAPEMAQQLGLAL